MTRTLLLALAALGAMAAPAPAATIDVSGSDTVLPLVADLAFFYGREASRPPRFRLVGGGSEAGVADAARGISDVGMVIRPRQATDPAGLIFTSFAASGVCLVTNRRNPLPGLARAHVQGIVAGTTASWSQVPGAARGDAIVPVAFEPGSAARTVFLATFVDLATPVGYAPRTLATAAQVRDFVRATPAAWGYVDLAFATGLHVVPYEGVGCTRAAIVDGSYPGRCELALVTKGAPRGAVARFLRWIRTSRTARRVIATRYVPLAAA